MSVEENKSVVRRFFELLTNGDGEGALALIDDNVRWWVGGQPDYFALAGNKTKSQFAELLSVVEGALPNGIQLTITGMTAEGDRVAVEVTARGEAPTGEVYNNRYHDLLILRNGKIVVGHEYLDPMPAQEILVKLGSR
ncbi:nuclear transport factor 2 family protein [Streptomyces sp. NPDC093228]|uniref:nuclear transport factor 2 family protein n=1 Tax=Streptomyces sp. NPDC093228 TaxID=3155070 RepID=UPI003423036D